MKALVIGGTGPTGHFIVNGLRARGFAVAMFHSGRHELAEIPADVRTPRFYRPGRVLQLRYPATTFGRGAEADYRFAEDNQMSRIHCAISADGERFILRDNESTNGTFVNGNRITEIELRSGDVVQFGEYEFDFIQGSR